MSRTTAGILLTFEENIDDESADQLMDLLRWIKGVVDVRIVEGNTDQLLAQIRVDSEWRMFILDMLKEKSR